MKVICICQEQLNIGCRKHGRKAAHISTKVATTKPGDSGGCARQTLRLGQATDEDRPICAMSLLNESSALRKPLATPAPDSIVVYG
jgi:hypothetical protein